MTKNIQVKDIAYTRSGDKGNTADIGVIAHTPEGFEFLKEHLSLEHVTEYCKPLGFILVEKYELPGLRALNFVFDESSINFVKSPLAETDGKTIGQSLLDIPFEIVEEQLSLCLPASGSKE
ncbi:MAG: hypothetical protein ACI9S8_001684 [Chlamydiales bacterium]|jgi:hypothetical protein